MGSRTPQGSSPTVADTGPPVLGRRERKKQATRNALHEAALRLALRHGVENVTVEQIADEADIAVRTFFNYFPSKESALVAPTVSSAEAIVEAFRARPRTESVLEAVRGAVLVVMAENIAASRPHIDALRLIRTTPSLLKHQLAVLADHEKWLADAIAERLGSEPGAAQPGDGERAGPDDLYPALCAAASIAALRVVLTRWLARWTGPETPSIEDFRTEFDRALLELGAGLDRPGQT